MKIACTVFVSNRLLPTLCINKPRKYLKSTLALCKQPKSGEYCIILFTNQDKNGTKYNLKGNIKQVLTKFVNEGKCTIQFLKPEHDLFINCDVIQLKGFLHLFRRVLENKVSDKELSVSSMAITAIKSKDIAPTKLVIKSRSEYPTKGFPRTLEELHINDIQRCGVDRGIFNLMKLRVLDLSHNLIESLPIELSSLQNLRELNVSHNLLGKGPSNWKWMDGYLSKNLAMLDLSFNELSMIPNQICKLHNLTNLNINNNLLRTLPTGIGNLRNLKIFLVANNNIKILPGSMKRLRLQTIDVAHNNFEQCAPDRPADIPKHLPVCTLKEYAARKALGARLPYPPGTLPLTVIDYLDNAKFCICGKACFEIFLRSSHNLFLANISEIVTTSGNNIMFVPIDCHFCSLKCFNFAFKNRIRHPIVR